MSVPNSSVSISDMVTHGTPATFIETVAPPSGYSITLDSVSWLVPQWPGPLVQQQTDHSLNFTYMFPAAGTYYVVNDVNYSVNTPYGSMTTSIAKTVTVIVT